jgi:hypothetical protein
VAVVALAAGSLTTGPAAVASAPVAVPMAVPVAASAGGGSGLRIESTTTYTVDLAVPVVRVRYDVTLTNQAPDVVSGGFINQRYFPELLMGVVAEASNIVATKADGTPLSVRRDSTESPLFSLATVDLSPDLYYPNSQTLSVTYDLPALAPRSEGVTRINPAFATFPVYGLGDPGATTVEVRIPDGLEVELIGSEMERTEVDGLAVYRAEAIADPEAFFVDVVARDDEKLVRRAVDLGETDVVVLGWPNDAEWADFVAGTVGDGVPALEELLGIDWPAERDIEVVETVAPYLYGYAGWFQPSSSLIEIGDELDAQVILHELSHVWFNDDLFTGRWINEALAEVFSVQALSEIGEDAPEPAAVDPTGPGSLRLNEWSDVDLQAPDTEEREAYGYNTSWAALDRIADEVGLQAVAAAVRVADDGLVPYAASTVDTSLLRTPNWQTLLDVLEEVAGSETAEDVFRELVVTDDQAAQLDDRTAARAEYASLVEEAEGWAPPAELRSLMSDWRFESADDLVPDVRRVLADLTQLREALEEIDAEVPTPLQATYEGARYVSEMAPVVEDALEAGVALRDAQQAHDDGGGPLAAVGLLFADVDGDLDEAHRSLQAGDYADAASQADEVASTVDGATTAGAMRLGAVALVLLAAGLLVRHRRGRRAATGSLPPPPPPTILAPVGGPPAATAPDGPATTDGASHETAPGALPGAEAGAEPGPWTGPTSEARADRPPPPGGSPAPG